MEPQPAMSDDAGDIPACPETGEYGELLCPRGESPSAYMPAITGELVIRDSGDRAGRRLDQADDDRDVWHC